MAEKEPRKSPSGKAYPPKDPNKRGTGNRQRKFEDPNLRVDAGDLTDLGVSDTMKGGKVKSSGFKATTRKTRPQRADGSMPKPPAEKITARVRQSGASEEVPISASPHHQAFHAVINRFNTAIRAVDGDTHKNSLRRILQTARDANNASARLHVAGENQSAVAELTRAAGSLTTIHGQLSRDPNASRHEDFDPSDREYIRNVLNDYKGM